MPSQTGVKITSDLLQTNIVGKIIKKLHTWSKDTHLACDIMYYLYKINIAYWGIVVSRFTWMKKLRFKN
jgi:hypothetical protein